MANTSRMVELSRLSIEADNAWHAAIVATYGQRVARIARYDGRGTATPELRALYNAKVQAYDRFARAAFPHYASNPAPKLARA